MNITVVGAGYVGLSMAVLLSQNHEVTVVDVLKEKIELINQKQSPIKDSYLQTYLSTKKLNLKATLDDETYRTSDLIIIATPTDYDSELHYFDTSSIESVLDRIEELNSQAIVVIKSTVPVGYTEKVQARYKINNIIFSPEFLREGQALYDSLYPSRIIVGDKGPNGKLFAELLKESAAKDNIDILLTDPTEAEAIKLFANTYLALRISFFNELDTYAEMKGLDTEDIIKGVSLDPRVGNYYNNPSFGYGGYCLPKDTQQLLKNYENVPQRMMTAVVDSNVTRKKHIASRILELHPKKVGIFRLTMKAGSDNFRQSAIRDIILELKQNEDLEIFIYEPTISEDNFEGIEVIHSLEDFKTKSDLIICNRWSELLGDVKEKVYTRDLFARD
ncbi:nucleotide sugar dehydrogenase [Streptococcus ferus]|uniref:nucleotide sugar dehydrogenase n=1 Tax=Streptococcus ferus TaxID=1345 RepID=UPI0035A1004B